MVVLRQARQGRSKAPFMISAALVPILAGALVVTGDAVSAAVPKTPLASRVDCAGSRDLALRNGKIITMSSPATVSEMVIRDGRVVHLGPGGQADFTPCTRVVDLKGRTAVPGLIDAHIHFVTWGFRPGHDVRLDLGTTVADVQKILSGRAAGVTRGEWITAVGGWFHSQLREDRLPTLAELDQAAPNNPVFLWERDGTPAVTNSVGRKYFEGKGLAVSDDGSILAADGKAAIAYSTLAREQTNPERGTVDAMASLASVGITTASDAGVNAAPAGTRPPERSWHSGHVDLYTAYDPLLSLARLGRLNTRVRISMLDVPDAPAGTPERLKYQFPLFGSDMLQTLCLGEFITPTPAKYEEAAMAVAARGGWCHEQHTMGMPNIRDLISIWERVNAKFPLKDRHWRLAHVWNIDAESLRRLKAIGAGVNVSPVIYAPMRQGPTAPVIPYRTIVNSGVPVGGISDGPNYMPVDPWVQISLMVTGRDSLGRQVVASSETLTRAQALQIYTVNNAWFMQDDKLGSIKVHGYGDVVVLDADYFSIPESKIRSIKAAVTIVDGRIIYTAAK